MIKPIYEALKKLNAKEISYNECCQIIQQYSETDPQKLLFKLRNDGLIKIVKEVEFFPDGPQESQYIILN